MDTKLQAWSFYVDDAIIDQTAQFSAYVTLVNVTNNNSNSSPKSLSCPLLNASSCGWPDKMEGVETSWFSTFFVPLQGERTDIQVEPPMFFNGIKNLFGCATEFFRDSASLTTS